MGQIAAITLTDGATTPVNRVFSPSKRIDEKTYLWLNRASGIAIGFDRLAIMQRPGENGKGAAKVTIKLVTPILEQTSPSTATGIQPAPTVAYEPFCSIDFVLPDRSVKQDRKNLLAMIRDGLNEAVITALIEDYDFVYGG